MPDRALAFQKDFNLPFNDTSLLSTALKAPGVTDSYGNKRLAHVGDSLLDLAFRVEGREREMSPGQVTTTKSHTITNAALSTRGLAIGLDRYIACNPSQKNAISKGLRADTMEAIIGAYWEDQGKSFEAVGRVLGVLGVGWPE